MTPLPPLSRRRLLEGAVAFGAALAARDGADAAPHEAGWAPGTVRHLLPTAGHDRILLKASLAEAPRRVPHLLVGDGPPVAGTMTDTEGLFWQFDATGLAPGRPHRLALLEGRGEPLCDPWMLSTLPAPEATPDRLRLLMYTCAGGHDALPDHQVPGGLRFLSAAVRSRMLRRALSFRPDAVVANGDHVYWDLRTVRADRLGMSPQGVAHAGLFDRAQPVLGTANERVLKRAVGPQVAEVYGTLFRGVPVFFLQDDHDHFDNDEADDRLVTFPPDQFMLRAARASQHLYYPEFLPDLHRPPGLPSAAAADRAPGVSESYGTLRWGRLAEVNLFDCRRHLSLAGASAGKVPPVVEEWLLRRYAESDALHLVTAPSTPAGWSAGKWGEWYVDMEDRAQPGRLTTAVPKPYWQPGWGAQHDRLLAAASARRRSVPLWISGDLHAIAEGTITRTGGHDLSANPVVSVLPGPVGTGRPGWPSLVRGTRGLPPAGVENREKIETLEWNGFILADFTREATVIRYFRWKLGQPEEELDALEPFETTVLPRPGA
jgi:PhoD-like phosphatase